MTAPVNIIRNGSQDISAFVKWDSVDSVSVLTKERGTMAFTILGTPAAASSIPVLADTIKLSDPSGTIFGGTVTEINTVVRGGLLLEHQITATDNGFSMDSKVVKAAYTNMDPADIAIDLVTRFAPAGFTTTHVKRGGFLISSIAFNYQQLTKCIEALAKQIGWDWYVDENKDLHLFFATTRSGSSEYNPAPIAIDDTSGNVDWPSIQIDNNIRNMKNSVYVIGGTYQKEYTLANAVDVYQTDGVKTVYPIAYKYTGGSMFVRLAGVVQSQGIDQQDDPTMFQVLYNSKGPFLRFTTLPTAGQSVVVTGFAEIPIVAHVQDAGSIDTYGEYQDSIVDPQIKSVQEAQERAQADITQFGHAIYDVKFNTMHTGLRIGQIIMLNSAILGVTNYPLVIRRIEASGFTPSKLKYQIEAIGSDNVTFTDIMLTLLQQQQASTSVDSSTVLQILIDIEEDILVDDATTVTGQTTPYRYGTAKYGLSKYNK